MIQYTIRKRVYMENAFSGWFLLESFSGFLGYLKLENPFRFSGFLKKGFLKNHKRVL